MKLYLCGGGSGGQIKRTLIKFSKGLDKRKPLLYIPLAMDKSKYDRCYEWFKQEIKYMNIQKFEMIKSSFELSNKDLNNYCAVFIGGGNTYKLLKDLKDNSNFEKIKKFLKDGGNIFGGSAGAIIFGNDINSCLIEDTNIVDLKNTSGFNLLNDYSILCHFKAKKLRKNRKYLKKYSKKYKTIYLPEEDTIYFENNKIGIIGNKTYIIFDNGVYFKHNFANIKKDINKSNI